MSLPEIAIVFAIGMWGLFCTLILVLAVLVWILRSESPKQVREWTPFDEADYQAMPERIQRARLN